MTDPLRKAWLLICASTSSPDVLRHALQFQQAELKSNPRKAMKAAPWLELRRACGSVETTHSLLKLLLLGKYCYFEVPAKGKGRPKLNQEQVALELASWRIGKLSIEDFAKRSRKYRQLPQLLVGLENQLPYARNKEKRHTKSTATHLLRRRHASNARRVLFSLHSTGQLSAVATAVKQRLMRAQRLTKEDRAFARRVTELEQLLQYLPGD